MECISISFRSAPEEVRKRFVFSEEEKEKFLEQAGKAVLVVTCNRTEVYSAGDGGDFGQTEKLLARKGGVEETFLRRIARRFSGKKALEHLYHVTCGMDSMVVGEDEILGQVRQAYLFSCERNLCGYELNTAFQGALACAKKVKTQTAISKSSVSIATLASAEIFHFQPDAVLAKKGQAGRNREKAGEEALQVLLIGGSGKMGSILLKNLLDREGIHVYATRRNHGLTQRESSRLTVVEYGQRYRYLDEADVVVSATESPHYTITAGEAADCLKTKKKRLFVDIAVPGDLDRQIGELAGCRLISIDDFERLARENNRKKQQAVRDAGEILEEELDELYKTLAFHRAAANMGGLKEKFSGYTFEKILYYLRDSLDAASLEAVLEAFLKEENG